MRRIACVLLFICILLSSVSCRSLIVSPSSTAQETTGTTEVTTEGVTRPCPPAVPDWIDEELSATALLDGGTGIVDCRDAIYTYEEMVEDLSALALYYPEHFSYRPIGYSVLGRTLYVGVLGNPEAKEQVVVSAAIHAREYMTAMLTMKQLEYYLAYYDCGTYRGERYADLFERMCFYVVPMTNPDGVMLAEEGISSVGNAGVRETIEEIYAADRKAGRTSEKTLDAYLRYWKANAVGVDLNRNYDALWEEYSAVSVPSATHYKGPRPASETETVAMMGLIDSLSDVRAVLCIHSQGEVLYWNCGQEDSLAADTLELTDAISRRNGYKVVLEQNNDASLSDWATLERGIPAVTIETGIGTCPLPYSQFLRIWRDNFDLYALTAAFL